MSDVESRTLTIGAGNYQKVDLTRRVPTVFIALGGSGKDVIMRLRKRFFDRFQTKDPGFAQFIFIDTDTQATTPTGEKDESFAELVPHQSELVAVPITPAQFNKTFRDLNAKVNCDHLSWLKLELEKITPQSVEHGAGTYRPMGRLAFFLNYTAIRATIEHQIQAALQFAADNPTAVEESRIEVIIVMSLAGGTGAGMFIDVAYLVQDILAEPVYHTLKGKSVTLICFLPGVFEDQKPILERLQQNAFAAFMELEHYGTPRTGDELFLGEMPKANGKPNQNWTGFAANWGDGKKKFIRGPGWDTCFLIDNRNDLDPNSPLSRREVFQMAADYLFLDFENHQFAIAKRSARCNLVQFKDKVKETWVRRPDNQNTNSSIYEGNAVYATQNGCRFSSFGLAEIFFDVEKLYHIAAYRLASALVRQRWISAADRFADAQYTAWVKEDLLNPRARADEDVPPSFLPENLMRRLLTAPGGCHLDDLKRETEALSGVEPSEGQETLAQILRKHTGLLREGRRGENGAVSETLADNLTRLSGDAIKLGPLRRRLRQLAASRCAGYGVAVTLNLLDKYRDAIIKVRERALQQTQTAPPDDKALLARLVEADSVPWPVHGTAVSIEYERAREQVTKAMQLRYEKTAAVTVDQLLLGVGRYLGSSGQAIPSELAKHGTLFGYYSKALKILQALAARLEKQFEVTFNDDLPKADDRGVAGGKKPSAEELKHRVTRRHSLSPKWDKATFDKRIDEALVGHPEIHKADKELDGFTFDWNRFETLVLQKLRELPRGDLVSVKNVDDLIQYCIENGHDNNDGIVLVADLLAEACLVVLHGAKDASGQDAGGFHLREEGEGNAIDLLVRQSDWAEVLEKMVKASMPYFQTTDPARISNDFSPAYSNLYSQKQGESIPSVNHAKKVFQRVRDLVASKASYIPNPAAKSLNNPLAAENSSIILVREMTGFPLQFYANLDALRLSYDKTISKAGLGSDVAHINFHEASETMPDITLLDTDMYAQIRDHVSFIIRAIILGVIKWREDVLIISVPDRFGGRGIEMRLGNRLHRAIKYACDTERVRKYLVQYCNDWETQATPRDWACLYASSRMTWEQLKPERDIRQGEDSSPLRNCYESLLSLATNRLNATEDGKRWLAALKDDRFEIPSANDPKNLATDGTFAQKFVRRCLTRLNLEMPIYQIMTDKVTDLEPPASATTPVAGPAPAPASAAT